MLEQPRIPSEELIREAAEQPRLPETLRARVLEAARQAELRRKMRRQAACGVCFVLLFAVTGSWNRFTVPLDSVTQSARTATVEPEEKMGERPQPDDWDLVDDSLQARQQRSSVIRGGMY